MSNNQRRLCVACGDPCITEGEHTPGLWRGRPHCWECLEELRDGKIQARRANLDSTGAGCPIEGSEDDGSPWQQNAIRSMEG